MSNEFQSLKGTEGKSSVVKRRVKRTKVQGSRGSEANNGMVIKTKQRH